MSKSSSSRSRGTRDLDKEDALTILNAVVEFRSKHGGSAPTPTTMKPVFDAVKDSLRQKITVDQLYNKFRNLKHHYYRAVNAGVGPTPFDRRFFDLSVKAWGEKRPRDADADEEGEVEDTKNKKKSSKKAKIGENGSVSAVADANGDASDDEDEEEDEDGDEDCDPFRYLIDHARKYWEMCGMPMLMLEMGLKFIDKKKAVTLEKKWRQHCLAQLKIEAKESELKRDLCTAFAAAMKNTGF